MDPWDKTSGSWGHICLLDNLLIRKYIHIYILYIHIILSVGCMEATSSLPTGFIFVLSPFQELWYIVLAFSDWFPFSLPERLWTALQRTGGNVLLSINGGQRDI